MLRSIKDTFIYIKNSLEVLICNDQEAPVNLSDKKLSKPAAHDHHRNVINGGKHCKRNKRKLPL